MSQKNQNKFAEILEYLWLLLNHAEGKISVALLAFTILLYAFNPLYVIINQITVIITVIAILYSVFVIYSEQKREIESLKVKVIEDKDSWQEKLRLLENRHNEEPSPTISEILGGRLTVSKEGRSIAGVVTEQLNWSLVLRFRISPAEDKEITIPFEQSVVQVTIPDILEGVKFKISKLATSKTESQTEVIITKSTMLTFNTQYWSTIKELPLVNGEVNIIFHLINSRYYIHGKIELIPATNINTPNTKEWTFGSTSLTIEKK